MVSSMFSLDHRLAELRPTVDELRISRELAAAAEEVSSSRPPVGGIVRPWVRAGTGKMAQSPSSARAAATR